MISFKARSNEKEIMDVETLDYETTVHTYKLISRVNRFLGGTRVILHHLNSFSKHWRRAQTIRILDIGTGGADIPQAIIEWSRRKNWKISLIALDSNFDALKMSRAQINFPEIEWIQAKNPELPFSKNSFDYVISSMFFHHLTDDEVIMSLKAFDPIAKRGIIINDLLRTPPAYYGFRFVSSFSRNSIFRKDGALSVLRGFQIKEAEDLVKRSGLDYLRVSRHFAYRLAIAGEKNATI
jgi:2-polyprenyl-3-methyl-5-hydroxy-6-metoxy-1,4-benzoquinol methylase